VDIGPMELLLVLGIVVVLFGAGRVADLGAALGRSVREFRQALHEDDDTLERATPVAMGPTTDAVLPAPPLRDFVPRESSTRAPDITTPGAA
jgi:sec-independent protein translocase protein TatA